MCATNVTALGKYVPWPLTFCKISSLKMLCPTHVKSLPSELSPSCSYRLGRIRRLTNYWSETMNKSNPCPRPGMDVARPTENRQPKDTKLSRRPYTEAELAAAVRAICFDRLGTRRAASVYGIPRSTLRNKICKLNELKKREEERLGGKSIVMADFLHSLIRSQKVETPETTRFPWSGHTDSINSTRPTVRETTDDPGRLFTTATHVASIFQVCKRKVSNNSQVLQQHFTFLL
ncbi:unnamed protein product [Echinostoma caproni]|uniref:HTH psq-type domain-containing protein n=1 Tax=Echinostoma caproni TaxID=27848 RepID=A0A183AC13_9TREM|nr:unnamed protein product [Echinostoma caproni]